MGSPNNLGYSISITRPPLGDPAFNHSTLAVAAANGWQNTHASPGRFI
jgi:hypothetical protein